MEVNFNIIVLLITIAVYFLLRYIKNTNDKHDKSSNLIYLICVPIFLYLGRYFYKNNNEIKPDLKVELDINSDLLTEPYPVTTTE